MVAGKNRRKRQVFDVPLNPFFERLILIEK
jgi:hypothetical protein